MNGFEVLYGGSSSQIEDVLDDSNVACASTLARCDVSEAMFDACALTQLGAACWGGLKHSQFLLQPLVTRDADRPPLTVC